MPIFALLTMLIILSNSLRLPSAEVAAAALMGRNIECKVVWADKRGYLEAVIAVVN